MGDHGSGMGLGWIWALLGEGHIAPITPLHAILTHSFIPPYCSMSLLIASCPPLKQELVNSSGVPITSPRASLADGLEVGGVDRNGREENQYSCLLRRGETGCVYVWSSFPCIGLAAVCPTPVAHWLRDVISGGAR